MNTDFCLKCAGFYMYFHWHRRLWAFFKCLACGYKTDAASIAAGNLSSQMIGVKWRLHRPKRRLKE